MSAQRGSELGRQRDQPRAVARLGRNDRALDDRAAHPQMRRRPVEDEVAPAQTDRLRDPQPGRGEQLEQRPPLRRYLVEQPHQLRPRQKAPLARRPCATRPPPRQHDLLGRVGIQQPFGDRRVKRQAQRRKRVGDRAITQPPGAARARRQPIHELLHGGAIEIAHPDLAVEVGQREVDQQATVLAARVRAHAVVPAAGVAIKPREAEPVQRRAATPRTRLAVALQLDRAGARPTCRPTACADGRRRDRPRRTSTHAGRRPARRSARVATPSLLPRCHRCCHLWAFARRPQIPYSTGILVARPRGFEPLTFGSVAAALHTNLGSSKPNPAPDVAKKSPRSQQRGQFDRRQ